MESGKKLKKEWTAESKGKQKFSVDLPFDLTTELGEVIAVELISPGVYYIGAKKKDDILNNAEVYVVMADAPAISEKARTYGQEFSSHPDLRVYDLLKSGSGRHIIDFEICRYEMKCHLPRDENNDSLYIHALYGAEEHPDYFGFYPVPIFTPRGFTIRHKTIINGVYWLETDQCKEMLAVCYPIWQADISIPEQNLGEQTEYDRIRGISNTLGYLFFPKHSSVIPLYELSQSHPEIKTSGIVDMSALLNTICGSYPEYTAIHNEQAAKHKSGNIIKKIPGVSTEFIRF